MIERRAQSAVSSGVGLLVRDTATDDRSELERAAIGVASIVDARTAPVAVAGPRRTTGERLLPRLVDTVPFVGPLLVGLATTVWLYDLLVVVRLLVTG